MERELVSFDGTERCRTDVRRPDRYRDLQPLVEGPGALAFRGAGLSYCLAGAATSGRTISMAAFDRILAVDSERRQLVAEAGVTVGQICTAVAAIGLWFPVLPGHPRITVGGCLAFNVHGKTQHDVGHMADHVESLVLLHPELGEVTCSRVEHQELFRLTLGGLGLTGLILRATLRLQLLPGPSVCRTVQPVRHLVEAAELMRAAAESGTESLYSWNDLNRRGPSFGRGLVFSDRFIPVSPDEPVRYRRLSADRPRLPPRSLWSMPTVRIVNEAYAWMQRRNGQRVRRAEMAAFPINGSESYYRAFGPRGLREYQLLIPHDSWRAAVRDLEAALEQAALPVTLGSLKVFSGQQELLWFIGEGVCLTLDVPAVRTCRQLFERLDRIAIQHGAIANLSKDSRIEAKTVSEMYPDYEAFAEAIADADPDRRVDTPLRRRLGL